MANRWSLMNAIVNFFTGSSSSSSSNNSSSSGTSSVVTGNNNNFSSISTDNSTPTGTGSGKDKPSNLGNTAIGGSSSNSSNPSGSKNNSNVNQGESSKPESPFSMNLPEGILNSLTSENVGGADLDEIAEYHGLKGIFKEGSKTADKFVAYGPYANLQQDKDKNIKEITSQIQDDLKDFSGDLPIDKVYDLFTGLLPGGDNLEGTTRQSVLGMPLTYGPQADPDDRVYASTIVQDIPVVYIMPGKAKLNAKIIDSEGKYINLDEYYEKLDDGDKIKVKRSLFSNSKNNRYLKFIPNFQEFWKYVQVTTSAVYSYTILTNKNTNEQRFQRFDFTKIVNNPNWKDYGIPFYYDRSSSFSEDISNSYSTSRIADAVNEKSSETREVALLGDKNGFSSLFTSVGENMKALIQGISDKWQSIKSYDYLLTKTANKLVRVVNGAILDFPEVFDSSKFDKNYNFTFKFYSPYGDTASILRFVLFPYLTLLTFAMTRQDTPLSYVEPFYVRIEAPGKCSIDMGVITSMSINKGGSENLWASNGLPRCIEVSISVMDLYPSMNMVRKQKMLRYNTSFSSYLENLAGVRTDSLTSISTEFESWLNRKMSNSWFSGLGNNIHNFVNDKLYGIQESVKDIFR